MRAKVGAVLAATVGVLVAVTPVRADVIQLRADEWCPFNCSVERKGYGVEIAMEIFAAAGHEIQYQLAPWSRSLEDCLRGSIDAVIGAVTWDTPDLVFGAEPIGQWDTTFVVRKGNPWRYTGAASLDKVKVAAIIGYLYMDPVGAYVESHKKDRSRIDPVGGTQPLDQALKMVLAGRNGAAMESRLVLENKLRMLGLADQFDFAGGTQSSLTYIAFSPKHPKAREYAEILDKGIAQMRASGRLAEILGRYGVHDWKQSP